MTNFGAVAVNSSTNSSDYGVYGRAGWINRLSARDEVAASVELWQLWQRVNGYSDPSVAFNPFNAAIATGTDRTNLVKVGGQWTHLFGSSIETNINGGFVQSFSGHSGIVATVTGDGTIVPTMGNQSWFEYGGRVGFRITKAGLPTCSSTEPRDRNRSATPSMAGSDCGSAISAFPARSNHCRSSCGLMVRDARRRAPHHEV